MGAPGNDRRRLLLIAGAAIAVIVASFLLRPDGPGEEAIDPEDRPSASAGAEPSAEPVKKKRKKRTAASAGDLPGMPGPGVFGTPPGMIGDGRVYSLPKHTMRITMTSSAPLGLVAWVIPTSKEQDRGTAKVAGNSWSLTTTVYGNPKYGTAFAQANSRASRVTCVITIDGREVERLSTSGPYDAIWCLG